MPADTNEDDTDVEASVNEKVLPVLMMLGDINDTDAAAGVNEKLPPEFMKPADTDVEDTDDAAGMNEKLLPVLTVVDNAIHKQITDSQIYKLT